MRSDCTPGNYGPGTIDSILLVEDEPTSRELLTKILGLKYPESVVFTAENGEAGLTLFRARNPAIVLTDIKMPVMDGMTMGRAIRRIRPDACIIALTAHSNLEGDPANDDRVFTHMVFKPVRIPDLLAAIEACAIVLSRSEGPTLKDKNWEEKDS